MKSVLQPIAFYNLSARHIIVHHLQNASNITMCINVIQSDVILKLICLGFLVYSKGHENLLLLFLLTVVLVLLLVLPAELQSLSLM